MKLFFAVTLALISSAAFSWGPQGHMIVAQLAENHLTPAAKASVKRILRNATLASVSNWADAVKGKPEWSHTKTWHFVTIEDGQTYSTSEHSHEGDVVSAISELVKVLRDQKASPSDKENALKFIVHFVGDIHQPLHVGRGDDRGGNEIRLTFEGKGTNLHALWDTIMIQKQPMDYSQYANTLDPQGKMDEPYDLSAFSFSQIIRECMSARSEIYNFRNISDAPIKLEAAYYQRNLALMNQQLLSGGKRLATLLNDIYR